MDVRRGVPHQAQKRLYLSAVVNELLVPELRGLETRQLSDDPIVAIYQMAQLCGLQSLDLQRVLEAPSSDLRAGLVKDLISDQADLVRMRLELG